MNRPDGRRSVDATDRRFSDFVFLSRTIREFRAASQSFEIGTCLIWTRPVYCHAAQLPSEFGTDRIERRDWLRLAGLDRRWASVSVSFGPVDSLIVATTTRLAGDESDRLR